ncbi:cell division protein ZapA [Thermodesulfobacterium hydrogeniphilum]|uniref:cell division protein ZapA n=1 Tax=Thermodesulfobacterium hydrogeniphilum TaxID=161156 RepID=UPI000570A9E3|nr:cell division protein ZapA [Thermodesulfobacterium hydrogeniphilum]
MQIAKEVSFEFLGQTFIFRAYIPEEEVKEVLNYLEEKKKEVEKIKKVPTFKLAIWLLLQVAHDYIKLKKEKEVLENYLKSQLSKLGEFLEKENITLGCSWKE